MDETLIFYTQLHKHLWEIAYPDGNWETEGRPQLAGLGTAGIKSELKELLNGYIRVVINPGFSDTNILERLLFNNRD